MIPLTWQQHIASIDARHDAWRAIQAANVAAAPTLIVAVWLAIRNFLEMM